jgi:hypothetical protein
VPTIRKTLQTGGVDTILKIFVRSTVSRRLCSERRQCSCVRWFKRQPGEMAIGRYMISIERGANAVSG